MVVESSLTLKSESKLAAVYISSTSIENFPVAESYVMSPPALKCSLTLAALMLPVSVPDNVMFPPTLRLESTVRLSLILEESVTSNVLCNVTPCLTVRVPSTNAFESTKILPLIVIPESVVVSLLSPSL